MSLLGRWRITQMPDYVEDYPEMDEAQGDGTG